ncbi:hypothetical protein WJX74_005078 [Apatococcus lobatus]|uniref:Uncharacterized protein n=1 Tax=Apatococcus lobatus TaxID=904363 RepID=A0AAW1R3H6_9CHLO
MAWSNFIITLAGVGAVVWFMKTDVRKSSTMVRQNLKTIRGWLEEQQASSGGASSALKQEPKQVPESKAPEVKKDS